MALNSLFVGACHGALSGIPKPKPKTLFFRAVTRHFPEMVQDCTYLSSFFRLISSFRDKEDRHRGPRYTGRCKPSDFFALQKKGTVRTGAILICKTATERYSESGACAWIFEHTNKLFITPNPGRAPGILFPPFPSSSIRKRNNEQIRHRTITRRWHRTIDTKLEWPLNQGKTWGC